MSETDRSVARRRRSGLISTVVALAAIGAAAALAIADKEETILISRQSGAVGGAIGDSASGPSSISADGRYVAFQSAADNLSEADDNTGYNVFVRDAQTGETTLISRQSAADGGAGADGDSASPSISADGRYVAFESGANNLSLADDNAVVNVFVRDTQASQTTLVSRQSPADGAAGADASSFAPSISADGRHVAFDSSANNLSNADNDAVDNIFVRDTQTNETTLASRRSAADGGAGGDGTSLNASISADGRYVAFQSAADNLSNDDVNTVLNVFVRDTQVSETTLVSRQSAGDGGAGADDGSATPWISADGRHVAFESSASNLSNADNDAVQNIFVRDTQANQTTLASRQSTTDGGAGANGDSTDTSISADGRYVSFASAADNLSDADVNTVQNIFARDTQANQTTLASRQSAANGGAGGDGDSMGPTISADGRFVAFDSAATNLSPGDSNAATDVFLRDVLGPAPIVAAADTTPPVLGLGAKRRQRLTKPVKAQVSCDEACSVVVKGTAKAKGKARSRPKRAKRVKLKPAGVELAAGETARLKLKPSRKGRRMLKAARRATAKVAGVGTDAAGNQGTARVTVKLR